MSATMINLRLSDDDAQPIYRRIADAICEGVTAGRIAPGEKLPPHLSLARALSVSPLTVSRGYELLQARGIVRQKRGSGTFVQADALTRLRTHGGRRYERLFIVLGETSPALCRRETCFIVAHTIDGIQTVISPQQTQMHFVRSVVREDLPQLTTDDAVVVLAPRQIDVGYAEELRGRGIPIVMTSLDTGPTVGVRIHYDRQQSVGLAVDHLVQRGYRRIGFIGRKVYPGLPVAPKYGIFVSLLHSAGLDIFARDVREAGVVPGRAYAAAREIIDGGDLPEAFFVDTDYKAMETISALNDAGIRVPEDVAIVSYDDVVEAASFDPPLTTVQTPRREIGRRAALILADWPTDGTVPDDVYLPSRLMVRRSCGSGVALPAATS